MKNIINHINLGSSFPASREDFETEEVYNNWKSIETKTIRELMNSIIIFFPNLNVAPPNSSHSSYSSLNPGVRSSNARASVMFEDNHPNIHQPPSSQNAQPYPPPDYSKKPPPPPKQHPNRTSYAPSVEVCYIFLFISFVSFFFVANLFNK